MEIYHWKRKDDTWEYFTLWVFEHQPRYGDEGVLQTVELHISNFILYETTFGRDFALEYFKDMTLETMNKYIEEYDYLYNDLSYHLTHNEFEEFKCWLLTSLTPIVEQRKVKIDKITNKLNATI